MDKQELRETFGFNLRIERTKKRYSQEYLAELASISSKHLTKIENGNVTPSIFIVFKLAKALNITVDRLVYQEYQ